MSFLEENPGVQMDLEGQERAEPQCSSEDLTSGPMEPGPSVTSLKSAHAGLKAVTIDPEKFYIRDKDHKVLVLDSGTLTAVPDKTYILPETFSVLASRFGSGRENKGSPILLAVSKGQLCLCCEKDKKKGHLSLQLKKQKLEHLVTWKEKYHRPYTFYRVKVGSWNMLESAAHPGWFISTSCNPGEPLEMTNSLGTKKYTEFSFEHVPKATVSPSEARV